MYELLDSALYAGIVEVRFWDMTLGEISREIKAWNARNKTRLQEQAYYDFTLASTIANYVGIIMGSKASPPSIYQTYPTIFEAEALEEKQQEAMDNRSVANFLNFANAFNQQFTMEEK